jgi:hypothetical protein
VRHRRCKNVQNVQAQGKPQKFSKVVKNVQILPGLRRALSPAKRRKRRQGATEPLPKMQHPPGTKSASVHSATGSQWHQRPVGLQQYSIWCCRCKVRYKAACSAMLPPCKYKVQPFAAAFPPSTFPWTPTTCNRRGNLQNQGANLRPCFVQLVQHGGCLDNPTNARSRALDRCDPKRVQLCRTRRKLQEVNYNSSWVHC